jgi:hypothetical protein
MDQAKTLAMFDLYHFLLIKEMWTKGECTGAHLLHQMLMYLITSVRTANHGRAESVRRWRWVFAVSLVMAYEWEGTMWSPRACNYDKDALYNRPLLHKFVQHAALRILMAVQNEVMVLEALDTRRLEHLFSELKFLWTIHCLDGLNDAWRKMMLRKLAKTKLNYEAPSKGKAVECPVVFTADDVIDVTTLPTMASLMSSAYKMLGMLIPSARLHVPEVLAAVQPFDEPTELLASLAGDAGRRPGEALNYQSTRMAHMAVMCGVHQSQAFAANAALNRAIHQEVLAPVPEEDAAE